jgi:hypothetical protein
LRKAPVIKASYAPEKIRYGDALKIYIEAEALVGDMLKIASVLDQVGYGHYPADWIYIKPRHQKHFRGYLQWNTFSSSASRISEWGQVTLKVSVFDKTGNESNVAVFPFQFVSEATPRPQPPLPFHAGDPRLGYLHINLIDPSLLGG